MGKPDLTNVDAQKPLPPLLDEFRSALRDEIEVAKRNASSSAIPLSNGHKVGEQGNAHQYAFLIDTVLNTPDGAPGNLIVPGRTPMEVTIVSVEGLRLVISVETDLGKFVPMARLQTNLTLLLRKLVERIENNASASNPAASRMLGVAPVSGSPKKSAADTSNLKEMQRRALESAIGRDLTVIWGPPGTGKTYTIGTIAEHLYNSARTVLIVSHTNIAVDQAIKHVAKSMPEHLEQGAVIRVGEVKDDVLKSDYPDVLLKKQVEHQSRELVKQREALASQRQDLADELSRVQKKISIIQWLGTAQSDIELAEHNLGQLKVRERQLLLNEYTLAELKRQHAGLLRLHNLTSGILALRKKLAGKRDEQNRLHVESSTVDSEITEAKRRLQQQLSRLEIVERITPLRQERAAYPTPSEQRSIIGTLAARMVEAEERLRDGRRSHSDADTMLSQVRNTSSLMRILKRLPRPEEQEAVISALSKRVAALDAERGAAQAAYENSKAKLTRILELDGELSRYEDIGTHSDEREKQLHAQHALQRIEGRN